MSNIITRHNTGPQTLGCPGQDYRVFSDKAGAEDYFNRELAAGNVVLVNCPAFNG
jgi:hypothetical protein